MTRTELKSLIKECLIEIITEGSDQSTIRESRARQVPQKAAQPAPTQKRPHPGLDAVVGSRQDPQRRPSPPVAQQVIKSITNDPVMASIFADTASSTLVEQVNADRGVNAHVETGVDPGAFEGAANWAALAFADSPRKNR